MTPTEQLRLYREHGKIVASSRDDGLPQVCVFDDIPLLRRRDGGWLHDPGFLRRVEREARTADPGWPVGAGR
jgi:hypothetical protein